jgi:hypothetical protein
MNKQRGFSFFLVVLITVGLLGILPQPAAAQTEEPTQTPTPTITPTPADQYSLQLDSGASLVIERHITFGEISITVALGVLAVLLVMSILVREAREWLR